MPWIDACWFLVLHTVIIREPGCVKLAHVLFRVLPKDLECLSLVGKHSGNEVVVIEPLHIESFHVSGNDHAATPL